MSDAYCKKYGCNFISFISTNLYGPTGNCNLINSYDLPTLFHEFFTENMMVKQRLMFGEQFAYCECSYVLMIYWLLSCS
jgi:nucleoside-diphosphate-sugar epimerase